MQSHRMHVRIFTDVENPHSGFKTSAQPKKLPRNHLISLTVEHLSPQFTVEYVLFARSIPNIHST
ncbi:hypothetical protein PCANC_05984 [Puccinia coronata f. sp. avenae]|uniref:Uncharacterized protein n=1 Tax=Puccinia coronata f. sp. avenae TaxID=200324 RepID=A0A2N5VU19_9BASI|nr:hypothetical protein PCANC_05984 [Puccinia coronata f. sp. avenae]